MARKAKGGRPVELEAAKLLSVRLPESIIDRLDAYAEFEKGRSEAIRKLLDSALKRKGF